MTEQTRNITEAVLDKKREDRLALLRKEKAQHQIDKIQRHLRRLSTLHLYGSTPEEVSAHKNDDYFGSWFQDVDKGDIHAMHSILDHFEPLEIITNMGHNYRSRFSATTAEIILDFRPGDVIPRNSYDLDGYDLKITPLSMDDRNNIVKSYLYSSILRMAKELILYFPMHEISFRVNCNDLGLSGTEFKVNQAQVNDFVSNHDQANFIARFEDEVL